LQLAEELEQFPVEVRLNVVVDVLAMIGDNVLALPT